MDHTGEKPRDPGRRRQGRPRQSEDEVGRDKLLERARVAMITRPQIDIQRREIAEVVGVTPALISYYFPDKWRLLEAAAHPIVVQHIGAIDKLLESGGTTEDLFIGLISIYISFSIEHGHTIDYYVASSRKIGKFENIRMMLASHRKIVTFFERGVETGFFRDLDPELMQSMLWSLCQYVSDIPKTEHRPASSPELWRHGGAGIQTLVLNLFSNGIFRSTMNLPHDAAATSNR